MIFRFSIEKLVKYLANDNFLVIIMSYIKTSKLERFHQRPVLIKNVAAYYRSIENMFNFSDKKNKIDSLLGLCDEKM